MTIHAGPYIQRTIHHHKWWADQFRKDAEALESKAADLRAAADEAARKAAQLAEGTDFAVAFSSGIRK
jgi:hypothetical protein